MRIRYLSVYLCPDASYSFLAPDSRNLLLDSLSLDRYSIYIKKDVNTTVYTVDLWIAKTEREAFMNTLLQIASSEPHFPYAATVALGLGFVAAVTIGSIAWYNSKRPAGWEGKERPDVVPNVDK